MGHVLVSIANTIEILWSWCWIMDVAHMCKVQLLGRLWYILMWQIAWFYCTLFCISSINDIYASQQNLGLRTLICPRHGSADRLFDNKHQAFIWTNAEWSTGSMDQNKGTLKLICIESKTYYEVVCDDAVRKMLIFLESHEKCHMSAAAKWRIFFNSIVKLHVWRDT